MTFLHTLSFDAQTLADGYRARRFTVTDIVHEVHRRIGARTDTVWLFLAPQADVLRRAAALDALSEADRAGLPLFGLPYGVKDNIDVAGWPTSAGCVALTQTPTRNAAVVDRLEAAGAVGLGKQHMDQFATGLVGVRSVVGRCDNAIDPSYIPGGSSSGSAVAVAAGLTTFSIGSDTGGSGRVPAAYNHIVGLKPTPGRVSSRGFLFCNRTFDVPPVFALTVDDAHAVLAVIEGADVEDPWTVDRAATAPLQAPGVFRFAVPQAHQREFFGDDRARGRFDAALAHLHALGGTAVEIDFAPFVEAGRLVFDSPLVAERWWTYGETIEAHSDAVHPVVAAAISNARRYSATDAFDTLYRLKDLQARTHRALADVDALVVPTVGTLYTRDELDADPVRLNNRMGHYTYFANPLQLAAISVPTGLRDDGLPSAVSLIGLPFGEARLGGIGRALQQRIDGPLGASSIRPSDLIRR